MFNDQLFWIFVIGISIWYIIYKKKQIESRSKKNSSDNNKQNLTDSHPDKYLIDIEDHINKVNSEIKNTLEHHKTAFDKTHGETLKKKKQLSEFAEKYHLDKILINIWTEIKYYPIRMKQTNFGNYNILNVLNCTLENESKGKNKLEKISFVWSDRNYQIIYEDTYSYLPDNDEYADFSLLEEGEVVFKITTRIIHEEYGTRYPTFSIETFKKYGQWYIFLLESHKNLEIRNCQKSLTFKIQDVEKIKENFLD